jgi:hypothetical protein
LGEENSRTVGTGLGFAAFGVAALTMGLWLRQVHSVALPDNRGVFVAFFVVAFALGVGALVSRPRWFAVIPALLAVVIGGFFPFSVAISRQEVATTGIQVGEVIPAFQALNRHGDRFDSAALAGKPVLMKFFRGHW